MNNAHATITRTNNEWSAQGRQDEDKLRGMRRRGRVESIADQLASWADEGDEFVITYEPPTDDTDPFYGYDDHKVRDPWEFDAWEFRAA